ncbi:MAG: GspH/FimT family pseudopilin [Gammaproteobacteria bacterium]|nr:GspH/FimT family pseudopilin [Gammaproteobacteria bacterium]MBT8050803.1 GspH/FimT family pseudopilin [Gammaproteobacteria bacterium]NNJ78629.1 prepilin-type N-terminal cleavage/methylation domain-containing protein [Xanthomonadales bacterium]
MMEYAPGVRPTGRSLFIRRYRGFSLIEVMMSVVLLAIGTAIALPSFRDQVEKRQVTNGAEQLASFINMAQGAAMKTNQVVTVSWTHTDSNDWCIGAAASESACDCTVTDIDSASYCRIGTKDYVLDHSIADGRGLITRMDGAGGSYAFDPIRGLFTDLDDALTVEMQSRSGDFRLNMMVNGSGRVTLCSDSAEHAVPGFKVCPTTDVQFVEAN